MLFNYIVLIVSLVMCTLSAVNGWWLAAGIWAVNVIIYNYSVYADWKRRER